MRTCAPASPLVPIAPKHVNAVANPAASFWQTPPLLPRAFARSRVSGRDPRGIRIFHGVADDYVSLPRCRSYVERLRTAGKNVELTEYAGAHGVQFKPPLKLPDAQATRNCRLEEVADGIVVNSQTKQRFTYNDPCVERGATVAYDEQAHKSSLQAVEEILRDNLKLN
jgi:acetyl esterase/lipase